MDIERYKQLIREATELDKQLTQKDSEITMLQNQWADENCPFKVGDVVPNKDYTYRDKPMKIERLVGRGNKRLVLEFNSTTQYRPLYLGWKVSGHLINKNGEVSKIIVNFRDRDYDIQKPDNGFNPLDGI